MAEAFSLDLKRTPLHALHRALGARMVPFAGYEMSVQFEGILAEHARARESAALFDVSHMGQARLVGEEADAALEALVPAAIRELPPGRQRYSQLLNEAGGILDDLMIARRSGNDLFLIVNAACKERDFAHIADRLDGHIRLEVLNDRALIALQGPKAGTVLATLAPEATGMVFMDARPLTLNGVDCWVSRSGYTGEDGFEISLPAEDAEPLARRLLDHPDVGPAGLGARDSLRLEAGLCLYGSDIDETTTPIEAGLAWSIQKRRRQEGGFPGASVIQRQLATAPARRLVGLRPEGRAPARAHTPITDPKGRPLGEVTSGGFGPTVGGPVAMGYVEGTAAEPGTEIRLVVRDRPLPARVVRPPFVAHRYRKD